MTTTGTKQIKRTLKLNFGRPIQMTTMRRMNKKELREITKKVTRHKKTVKSVMPVRMYHAKMPPTNKRAGARVRLGMIML